MHKLCTVFYREAPLDTLQLVGSYFFKCKIFNVERTLSENNTQRHITLSFKWILLQTKRNSHVTNVHV